MFIRQTIKEIASNINLFAVHVHIRGQADMWKNITVLNTFSGSYLTYTHHMTWTINNEESQEQVRQTARIEDNNIWELTQGN